MASKCYGQVKPDYVPQTSRDDERPPSSSADMESLPSRSWSRQVSRTTDIMEGADSVLVSGSRTQHHSSLRRKDSVAKLTWSGLTYIATVSPNVNLNFFPVIVGIIDLSDTWNIGTFQTVARRRSKSTAGVLPTHPATPVPNIGFPAVSLYDDNVFEDSTDPFSRLASQVGLSADTCSGQYYSSCLNRGHLDELFLINPWHTWS